MASLYPQPKAQFFAADGTPAVGYKVYTYVADGTFSTLKSTYSDTVGTANTNPIILDSRGEATIFWDGIYDVKLTTDTGGSVWTQTNVGYGFNDPSKMTYTPPGGSATTVTLALDSQTFDSVAALYGSSINTPSARTIAFTKGTGEGGALWYNAGSGFTPTTSGTLSTHIAAGYVVNQLGIKYALNPDQPFNVEKFGATGDGSTVDRAAMQAAIDCANALGGGIVILTGGKTFITDAVAATGIATGVTGIVLKDNVTLQIDGTLKVVNGAYGAGAFFGAIRSLDTGLTNAHITGKGTVDGNVSNQVAGTQASNIYLVCIYNVSVTDIYSNNANGQGIQLVPVTGNTMTACHVNHTFVNNCTSIGIQVSHSLYSNIIGNTILSCTNNLIDIYGENGTSVPDNGTIVISGNTGGGGLVGTFVETSGKVVVSGNSYDGCVTGVHTNRINGSPGSVEITGNVITNTENGLLFSGDMGGVHAHGNTLNCTVRCIYMGYGGNVSDVLVENNFLIPTTTTVNLIEFYANAATFCKILNNFYSSTGHSSSHIVVYTAITTSTGLVVEDPIDVRTTYYPIKNFFSGSGTSGGTDTIAVPVGFYAARLIIKATSGGGWYSVWSGMIIADGTNTAAIADSTTYIAPGNAIASVAGGASTSVTITWAATGSGILWNAYLETF